MTPAGRGIRVPTWASIAPRSQPSRPRRLIGAAGTSVPLLLLGVALFGIGFGNATSLPPLIAQIEFVEGDVPRVVALIVGIAQGGYAFAPATFGLVREFAPHAPEVFVAAAFAQGLAICAFSIGRNR